MSASQPGNMRGPRMKTPLLLLLLLLTTLTGTALCQDEDPETEKEDTDESSPTEATEVNSTLPPEPSATDDHGSGHGRSSAGIPEPLDPTEEPSFTEPTTVTVNGEDGLDLIIILIPAVLVVVIIGMIVCGIFISRRWNKKTKNEELRKEDPYLDESCTEKVPMPMFEEDVPSVLELEMEELDQWMKKEG